MKHITGSRRKILKFTIKVASIGQFYTDTVQQCEMKLNNGEQQL
jgi:hypothetical protein